MKITNPITLDVARSNSYICLLAKQFDENSRHLQVTLTNNGQPLPIPSGAGVVLRATRADGAGSMTAGTVNGDGTALVEIDETVLEVAGAASLSIEVTSGGQVLTSASCNLTVQKADASGWVKVYVAAASVSAGTYHISLAGQSYSFTTTQAIPAGGAIYFNSDGGTAQTRDASGNVLDASLTLTAGTSGTELTSDVPTMTFLASLAQQVGELADTDNLVAGSAEALLGGGTAENVAVALRGNAGNAREKIGKLIGGTIAWNQIQPIPTGFSAAVSGLTITATGDGGITVSGTASESKSVDLIPAIGNIPANHVLVFTRKSTQDIKWGRGGFGAYSGRDIFLHKHTAVWDTSIRISFDNGTAYNFTAYFNCLDITTNLGPTIADYVYTLESGTAGAGVAWLARYFPKILGGYYAYAAPALQSVNVEGKKISGFNLWDEEWEYGSISSSTGQNDSSTPTAWRTKNYIPIIPNSSYYITASVSSKNCKARFYDAAKNYIGYQSKEGFNIYTKAAFISPDNAYFMRLSPSVTDVPAPNHDICLNLSNPLLNGQYFPHREFYYPIQSGELRGVPKLDANNNLTFDGDWQEPDGTRTRRYGAVDLGTLTWSYVSGQLSMVSTGLASAIGDGKNVICSKYKTETDLRGTNWTNVDKAVAINKQNSITTGNFPSGAIVVKDTDYTNAATFKTAMSGVYLVYELATPTTEAGQPFLAVERLDNGIEEVVDAGVEAGTRDVVVPVGQDATIYRDLAALLGAIPNPPTSAGTYTLRATVTTAGVTFSWS